jgi:hypothetical protein
MTHIWQGLRSGEWLTAARIRGYSLIVLGLSVLVFAGWIAISGGLIDRNGQPIGTDFSNVYAATLGGGIWHAFADSMNFTQTVVLEQGGTGWQKIQSIFSAVRIWGGSVPAAYAIQGSLLAMLAASLAWLWHSDAAFELKAAALAVGSLLATPYVLDYDLIVLAVASAFFARHGLSRGFRDFEISLLAAAWIVPLLSRGIAGATSIPLGLLVLLAFYVLVLRRAALDRASVAVGAQGIAQA